MRHVKRIAWITVAVVIGVFALHSGLAAWSKSAALAPNSASRVCTVCHR
jgi:hypothetical protein